MKGLNVLSNRREHLAVLCLILLGLGLRVCSLGAPSLWLDEAVSANIAAKSIGEYLSWAKDDFHPPLYYVLLHFWSFLGHDEFTLRFLSVITNCLSGIILYFAVRRLFNPSTALLTLLLFTLSPFQIRYSQEVRMYSPRTLDRIHPAFYLSLSQKEELVLSVRIRPCLDIRPLYPLPCRSLLDRSERGSSHSAFPNGKGPLVAMGSCPIHDSCSLCSLDTSFHPAV